MFDQVVTVISDIMHVSKDSITRDTLLVDDLGVDSLNLYQILLALEDAFDADLNPDLDNLKIRTVGELCEHLKKLLSEG